LPLRDSMGGHGMQPRANRAARVHAENKGDRDVDSRRRDRRCAPFARAGEGTSIARVPSSPCRRSLKANTRRARRARRAGVALAALAVVVPSGCSAPDPGLRASPRLHDAGAHPSEAGSSVDENALLASISGQAYATSTVSTKVSNAYASEATAGATIE